MPNKPDLFFAPAIHRRVVEREADVPGQRPVFELPIDRVGIAAKTVWLRLPQGRIPFQAEVTVSLAGDRRGIHMSRIEEEIARLAGRSFADPAAYAAELCRSAVTAQGAAAGEVAISGSLPVERAGPVSGRTSHDSVPLGARCRLTDGRLSCEQWLGAYHITACPCTQVYTAGALGQDLPGGCPHPTHSQRSLTTLSLRHGTGRGVGYGELAAVLGEALHLVQDLLKRPDEAELVLAAHLRPQFAEDVVREVALACGRRFAGILDPDTAVHIESRSQESIHVHDVVCRLHTRLGAILARMAPAAVGEGGAR